MFYRRRRSWRDRLLPRDPFTVAARIGAKYRLNEVQEQLLRAVLAGVPDEEIWRIDGKRRSLTTISNHRRTIFAWLKWYDRLHLYWVISRNRKHYFRKLGRAAVATVKHGTRPDLQPGK